MPDTFIAYFDANDSVSLVQIGPKEMPDFLKSEAAKFRQLVEKSGARAD